MWGVGVSLVAQLNAALIHYPVPALGRNSEIARPSEAGRHSLPRAARLLALADCKLVTLPRTPHRSLYKYPLVITITYISGFH